MKTSISYRYATSPQEVEVAVDRYLAKINKLLKSYAADLVQLHASFEKHPRRIEYLFSVNLSLPTGTLHATGSGPDPKSSARRGFVDLEKQIKKHQAHVRKDYEWKRKRGKTQQAVA
jgi:ribosome-associated translation inhibitor RaiA